MIYHVFANRSNAGDWLSALGIQKLLGDVPLTECFCDVPFVDDTLEKLRRATPEDFIIIGGGGLLMDYFLPFWQGFLPLARRANFAIWGVGCCEMKWGDTRPTQDLLREIVSLSRLCVVRDALTHDFLGGSCAAAPVLCPSFAELTGVPTEAGGVLHSASYEDQHPEVYETMRRECETYADATKRVFRETNNRLANSTRRELDRIVSVYAQSDLIVSARLHGCIMAVALGKKVVAVSNDWKIEAFMRVCGLEDWVLDYSQVHQLPGLLREAEAKQLPAGICTAAVESNRSVAARVLAIVESAGGAAVRHRVVD